MKLLGEEGADRITMGRFYVDGASCDYVWVRDLGTYPPGVEGSRGFPPPVSTADGRYGPQTSTGWDIGVPTHWGGAGNGGDV